MCNRFNVAIESKAEYDSNSAVILNQNKDGG